MTIIFITNANAMKNNNFIKKFIKISKLCHLGFRVVILKCFIYSFLK